MKRAGQAKGERRGAKEKGREAVKGQELRRKETAVTRAAPSEAEN